MLRLSLLQLGKVVLACAVASACITPTFRLVQYGVADLREMLVADAVVVPLAWAALCFPLARRGPGRDALILGLLLASVLVTLGYTAWICSPLIARVARHGPRVLRPIDAPNVAFAVVGIPLLAGMGGLLLALLVRARRPGAGSREMPLDEGGPGRGGRLMARTRGLRLTLGGLLILVALIAVGIAAWRPKTTRVVDVKVGTGPAVKVGDTVEVHYAGQLADGTTFDSSKGRGPFSFGVGGGQVIKGWDAGLVGMRAGGVRRLFIPPEEGYGAKGAPPVIPPDATLSFEVELLKVR